MTESQTYAGRSIWLWLPPLFLPTLSESPAELVVLALLALLVSLVPLWVLPVYAMVATWGSGVAMSTVFIILAIGVPLIHRVASSRPQPERIDPQLLDIITLWESHGFVFDEQHIGRRDSTTVSPVPSLRIFLRADKWPLLPLGLLLESDGTPVGASRPWLDPSLPVAFSDRPDVMLRMLETEPPASVGHRWYWKLRGFGGQLMVHPLDLVMSATR